MNTTEKFTAAEITANSRKEVSNAVVKEYSFKLYVNGKEMVTLLCSPTSLEYLVAGYLFSQGIIHSKNEIKEIIMDEAKGRAVVTVEPGNSFGSRRQKTIASSDSREIRNYTGLNHAISPITSQAKFPATRIFALVDEFIHKSDIFKETGGVHSAAICSTDGFIAYSDDIGRHNAVDKVIGECVMRSIPGDDKILLTSGRISSEILLKAARAGIPIAVTKSAVTDGAIKYANELGMTLIGFVRGEKMIVYANDNRIMLK